MVALLFDGNCNAINGDYYVEDGGIGGDNNFHILAIAEEGYYFLVIHEKSLNTVYFGITATLNSPPKVIGDDPLYPDQWHLNNPNDQEIDINAPEAWEITRGCPSVLVAVIDTKVDITHPDLAPNHDDRYDNSDIYGKEHGTSVAGVIAAKGNNGIGVSGVAPEVSFVSRGTVEGSDGDRATSLIRDKEQVAISNNSWVVSNASARDIFIQVVAMHYIGLSLRKELPVDTVARGFSTYLERGIVLKEAIMLTTLLPPDITMLPPFVLLVGTGKDPIIPRKEPICGFVLPLLSLTLTYRQEL